MGDREQGQASEPVKNIVLVGRDGNGKSATGNSLIGKEVFISESMECQTCTAKTSDGLLINVIDTPSLFDLSVSADNMNKEIINCLKLAEGGLHVVVLVLSIGTQISQEEESALSTLQLLFGSKIVDYLVVLFTGGDVLEKENKTLDDYLSIGCPKFLKNVLRLCGGRRVLFDNKATDEAKKVEQVNQLLAHVADIEKRNGGKAFAEEMLLKIQRQNEIIMEQQKEVESKDPVETEVKGKKKQLDMSVDQNMNMTFQMMENRLKESHASQKKMMIVLANNINNEATDEDKKIEQVNQLLAHVADNERSNGGKAFAEEMQLKIQRQNEMIMEHQKEVESKDHVETEVKELKNQLDMSVDQNMNMMLHMMENRLKESQASQEKMMIVLAKNIISSRERKSYEHSAPICNIM